MTEVAAGMDAARAVQTVADDSAGCRWFGSGYLVAADLVLTAWHVLHRSASPLVRFVDAPGRVREVSAEVMFADATVDVAVLRLHAAEPPMAAVAFGDPAGPVDCEAVGFPRFKLNNDHRAAGYDPRGSEGRGLYRDSHHARGVCHPASNRYAGTLELTVSAPGPDTDAGHSPWEGMSGAAVFAEGRLIAVVNEHHVREGLGRLTASRVARWFELLSPARIAELGGQLGLPAAADRLDAVRSATSQAAVVVPVPVQMSLPRDSAVFTGRGRALGRLRSALDETGACGADAVLGVHTIDGMAGVGKTAFAVHAAHMLADRFPDGQLFVHLHGHTPGTAPADPDQVLAALLAADGVSANLPPAGQARADLWRTHTAGRRMLLVLDDAVSSAQVQPLLPSAPGSLVLVTSRRKLTGLTDAVPVSLDVLDPSETYALFARIAGRPELAPDSPQVAHLARLCDHLPLAIGIAAARLRHHRSWTAEDLIDELAAAAGRLPALVGEEDGVAAAFELSYRDLSSPQRQLFRALGASPNIDTDVGAAAAMLDLDRPATRRLLRDLEEHHLLDEPTYGRYQMHDLLREYARTLADNDPEHSGMVVDRLLAHYQSIAAHQVQGAQSALPWLRGERSNLLACLEYATRQARDKDLTTLTSVLAPLLLTEGPWQLAETLHARAVAAAERLDDPAAAATALNDLGRVRSMTGDYAGATRALERALSLFQQISDRIGQAAALNDLGRMRFKTGNYAGAARDQEQALALARQNSDRTRQAAALHELGRVRFATGDYADATRYQEQALDLFRQVDDRIGQTAALNELGLVWRGDDDAGAIRFLEQPLELARQTGDQIGQVDALYGLGVRSTAGDPDNASRHLEQSLELARRTGDRFGQTNALGGLGNVRRRLADPDGAIRFLEQSLELARQTGHRLGQAVAFEEQGEAQLSARRTAEATACLREALEIYRELGLPHRADHVAVRMADIDAAKDADSPD